MPYGAPNAHELGQVTLLWSSNIVQAAYAEASNTLYPQDSSLQIGFTYILSFKSKC